MDVTEILIGYSNGYAEGVVLAILLCIFYIIILCMILRALHWHVKACKSLCEIKFLIDNIKKVKEKEYEKDQKRSDTE